MTTITFADHELEELKNFYQIELDKITKRAEDLKSILQKISGQTEQSPLIPPKQTTEKPLPRQSRPRRSKNKIISWRKFIPKLLKREDKFLNINDIANSAIEKFNLTDRIKTVHSLSVTLPRMTKMGLLKSARKEGERINYYGLSTWTKDASAVSDDTKSTAEEKVIESKKTAQGQTKYARKTKAPVIPWKKFIPQIIKEKGSLSLHELAEAAIAQFKHPHRAKVMKTLGVTLGRMTQMGKLTFDRKPGQKTHLYGLSSIPAKIKKTNGASFALTN